MTVASAAQPIYTKLVQFTSRNHKDPDAPGALVQGTDGNFYGPTYIGGANQGGTIFKMTPMGQVTILYNFCAQANCNDGAGPNALTLATDGNFYGTTVSGGNGGTVFKITPEGMLTTLYNFCSQPSCTDGIGPYATLFQGVDGNFYGTTSGGNITSGTIFQITPKGKLTTLYRFCSLPNCADGADPQFAGLVQGNDGNFYGTTGSGGINNYGTVFKINSRGKLTTLYNFCPQLGCLDGFAPIGGVVQGTDGNFYGTTASGGYDSSGTIFRITPKGALSTLYAFCGPFVSCKDGMTPGYPLIQATDGLFYGTTEGTIFSNASGGIHTTLYDSGFSSGALVQATNGVFYGAKIRGGGKDGAIFSLAVGLGPFVEATQRSGKAGQSIMILGQGFTGTTDVSFNGTTAGYTVVSDTYLTAKVPTGATTGLITVAIPGGSLTSNKPFVVKP